MYCAVTFSLEVGTFALSGLATATNLDKLSLVNALRGKYGGAPFIFYTLLFKFESPWKLFIIRFSRRSFIFTLKIHVDASAIKRRTSNRNVNTKNQKWKTFVNNFSRLIRWSTLEIFWKHLFVNLAFLGVAYRTVLSSHLSHDLCKKQTFLEH